MPTRPRVHRLPTPFKPASTADERPTAHERGYDRRWQKARLAFLAEHCLCECDDCRREGRLLPAEVVDHARPHRGDPALFWDSNNWQAMSKPPHDRKTAREDGGFGRRSARRPARPG